MACTTSQAFLLSRFTELSLSPYHRTQPPKPPPFFSRHLLIRPLLPSVSTYRRRVSSFSNISCLISGVDGGGVSDDFVSTRKSGFSREFAVIASMLKRIEPLDSSVISKGVSDSTKDSMKQTISTMLGLLPSDQFSVTVKVSKHPLHRLIVSSIITGYTLWNAEYRVALKRNFDISSDDSKSLRVAGENDKSSAKTENVDIREIQSSGNGCHEASQPSTSQDLRGLSPQALSYIRQLEMELYKAKQELDAQKQESLQMEYSKRSNNDLLEYLRSLDPDMVIELSKPSSFEVEEVIHQLAQNILQGFFKEEIDSESKQNDTEYCQTVGTSRDYLAKLLFWCMLLGHHLRGLGNRLHLSCVVGLL